MLAQRAVFEGIQLFKPSKVILQEATKSAQGGRVRSRSNEEKQRGKKRNTA